MGFVLFLVGQYNNSSDILPTFLLPLVAEAAGALVGFSLTEDCLKPSTDGARVVAELGTALLLAASNWTALSLPPAAFTGASTCTGVRDVALIRSLTEPGEDDRDTGDGNDGGDLGSSTLGDLMGDNCAGNLNDGNREVFSFFFLGSNLGGGFCGDGLATP